MVWSIWVLFIIERDRFNDRYSLDTKFESNVELPVRTEWNGTGGENEWFGSVRSSTLGTNAIVAWAADA